MEQGVLHYLHVQTPDILPHLQQPSPSLVLLLEELQPRQRQVLRKLDLCVLGVSGVPLPILVASSLYLVFTLKRLQTVIRLIKPACYFSASGCFGVLAKCPGFGIFRQTQHFGLQKKKDSNCTKIILFKYL